MNKSWRVILIVESSRAYGRSCLQGIASYARTHGPWTFLHIERGVNEDLPKGLADWGGDGIITRIEIPKLAHSVRKLGLPMVDLRGRHLVPGTATLNTDQRISARMAADHFLERGFKIFGYCGLPGVDFSEQRSVEYANYLCEKSRPLHIYQPSRRQRRPLDLITQELRGSLDHADIVRWLRTLPRPIGIMACNDARGRQVLDACAIAGLRVPEEVAVIGVDNDEVLCDLADPPLSSIVPDALGIGYRGAAILDQILQGKRPPNHVEYVAPRGIVTRRSSDILAIDDQVVAEALHLIRQRACGGEFNVETLLDGMTVSRATLERRFASVLGYSPKQEIQKVRLARVKQLLQETSYPLWTIAGMAGFKTAAHLSVAFKTSFGLAPGRFRQQQLAM